MSIGAVDVVPERSRERRIVPWLVGAAALAGFLFLHVGNFAELVSEIGARAGVSGVAGRTINGFAFLATATYIAFALSASAVAAKTGDRIIWMLPAIFVVLSPLPGRILLGDGEATRPILEYFNNWGWPGWLSAVVDLTLVLLPGSVVAARPRPTAMRADRHQRLAVATCALTGLFAVAVWGGLDGVTIDELFGRHLMMGVLFALGAALGVRRPWYPWVHIVVAVLLSSAAVIVAGGIADGSMLGSLTVVPGALPLPLAAVGLGAVSDIVASALRRHESSTVPDPARGLRA